MLNLLRVIIVLALCLLTPLDVHAFDKAELETLGKILALSKDIPTGEVEIVTVYNPAAPSSVADYNSLQQKISEGVRAPKHILKLKGVTPASLETISSAKVVVLTSGLSTAELKTISAQTANHKVLCATSEISYVNAGYCMLGVEVGNNVNIVVNRMNLEKSGLKFDAIFQFMVTEI